VASVETNQIMTRMDARERILKKEVQIKNSGPENLDGNVRTMSIMFRHLTDVPVSGLNLGKIWAKSGPNLD
jgi:hypothetical protein